MRAFRPAVTKNTKATETTKKTMTSHFDGLHPLAAPRFARWQE